MLVGASLKRKEDVRLVSGQLELSGYALPGSSIELFVADPDASGFGEGKTYLMTLVEGAPAVAAPDELRIEPGTTCVGDGAVRYREVLQALGAKIPPHDRPKGKKPVP